MSTKHILPIAIFLITSCASTATVGTTPDAGPPDSGVSLPDAGAPSPDAGLAGC